MIQNTSFIFYFCIILQILFLYHFSYSISVSILTFNFSIISCTHLRRAADYAKNYANMDKYNINI